MLVDECLLDHISFLSSTDLPKEETEQKHMMCLQAIYVVLIYIWQRSRFASI